MPIGTATIFICFRMANTFYHDALFFSANTMHVKNSSGAPYTNMV